MNQFIQKIITNAVLLLVSALKFVPNLTQELFNQAIDEAVLQLQNAKADFATVESEDTLTVVEGMVEAGLEVTQAALDAKGDTQYDGWLGIAENFIANLGNNGGHPIAAAIKSWFQKVFSKKTSAAPVTANPSTDESVAK